MKVFLPYLIIIFIIFALSKALSFLKTDGGFISIPTLHAGEEVQKEMPKTVTKIPEKVSIQNDQGQVIGQVFNLDTSQIQKINSCNKLYDLSFSPKEIDILKSLRTRHQALQALEEEIKVKEEILKAVQKTIENQIQSLEDKSNQLDTESGLDSGQNYLRLVKIYEGMKPTDAAKIFDELQTSILIEVARQMKENKLSAIVSAMKPAKARDLTLALAKGTNSLD
jgi:flagellar motility protein MotE (MotC chaperone)